MEHQLIPISIEDSFTFSCTPGISCFNECCRDLNQFLTPYDILRLRKRLDISSTEFLSRYTTQHTGPETGLPIVRLREDPTSGNKCPFVTEKGCSVYEDRPSSCRAYPIIRVVSRNRESGILSEHFALIKEPHCRGHEQRYQQTVREWIHNQGLAIYNEMNDMLMEIISLKNQRFPGPLDFISLRHFQMACYDLDSFREQVFHQQIKNVSEFDPQLIQNALKSDTDLLKLSLKWLKFKLFGTKD